MEVLQGKCASINQFGQVLGYPKGRLDGVALMVTEARHANSTTRQNPPICHTPL